MPTIVDILTFISMINTTSERLKARQVFIFQHVSFMGCWNVMLSCVEHEKFISAGSGAMLITYKNEICNLQNYLKKWDSLLRGLLLPQFVFVFCVWFLFCYIALSVLFNFANILLRKRELVAFCALCLYCNVSLVGLWSERITVPAHTHLNALFSCNIIWNNQNVITGTHFMLMYFEHENSFITSGSVCVHTNLLDIFSLEW